ncbi:MAG: hypothetical protein SFU27_14460 [Thermonemataceae bacterium]|nr:hypothetical protein [Thermonemataceae bacterium]
MEYNRNQENEALRTKELQTIIKICDEFKNLNSNINPFIYFKKAQALLALGKEQEGLRGLWIAQEIFEENYGNLDNSYSWTKEISDLYLQILIEQAKRADKPSKALWFYNEAYQLSKEPEQRYEFKRLLQEAYQDLVHNPIDADLKNFVLLLDEDLPNGEPQYTLPLLYQHLGALQLIGNKPRKNSFWLAHPYKKAIYYDFEQALQLLFSDYVNEFVQLLQHLGATKLNLTYTNNRQEEGGTDPAAEKLPDDISANKQRKINTNTLAYNFQPTQRIHLPTNLAWYASQTDWQAMVAERTQGSLASYEIILSTANLLPLSDLEIQEALEEAQELLEQTQKASKIESGGKQKRRSRKTNMQEKQSPTFQKTWEYAECHIYVEFANIESLKAEVNLHTLEMVEVNLDKIASETRKMESVDVSSVVNEIVNKVKNQGGAYKPQEQEEEKIPSEVKKEDNIAPDFKTKKTEIEGEETAYDKWKRLIQEERKIAKELIEQQEQEEKAKIIEEVLPQRERTTEAYEPEKIENFQEENTKKDSDGFTQEERFYYEMLQHAYQDGAISEDVRKVLERRRQRFKISEQRAAEIEQIMLDKSKVE